MNAVEEVALHENLLKFLKKWLRSDQNCLVYPVLRKHKAVTKTISRTQAQANGLIRYFTGTPCKRGHISERYTINAACCECYHVKRVIASSIKDDPRSAYIIRLWNTQQPVTMQQIGANLGTTRNAIAGVLRRAREQGVYVLPIGVGAPGRERA